MQIKKTNASTRWIYPFPESHPEFALEMKILTRKELIRIYDKHGIKPGSDDLLLGQSFGALEDLIKAQVVGWTGLTDANDNAIPCSEKTKIEYLFDHQISTDDGETTNIWSVAVERFNAELEAEEKN